MSVVMVTRYVEGNKRN